MSLRQLISSIQKEEILLPHLRAFLAKEASKEGASLFKRKKVVIQDSLMTIESMRARISEYNHGEQIEGDYFHPSALGACMRMIWFDRKKAPKDDPPRRKDEDLLRTHLIFETGTYVGLLFANLCQRAGILVKREAPIKSAALKMLGHADLVVRLNGLEYVVEVKTINSRQFNEVLKLNKPQKSHRRQITAYMKGLGIPRGMVVYLEKDRHRTREFVMDFDQEYYERIVRARVNRLFRHLRKNIPPKKEGLNPNKPPCLFCEFTYVCFGTTELNAFLKKQKSTSNENPKA